MFPPYFKVRVKYFQGALVESLSSTASANSRVTDHNSSGRNKKFLHPSSVSVAVEKWRTCSYHVV